MSLKKTFNKSQGYVLRANNYSFTNYTLSGSYTKILDETKHNRVDVKVDFQGDGDGFVLITFDPSQTDDTALRFNDSDTLLDSLSSLLSNYSGEVYAKHSSGSAINCVVWEAIKE